MQKNDVDLVKSFPTNTYLQNLASIQKRTSPIKFAHLAEKSANGSISNLSTKRSAGGPRARAPGSAEPAGPARFSGRGRNCARNTLDRGRALRVGAPHRHPGEHRERRRAGLGLEKEKAANGANQRGHEDAVRTLAERFNVEPLSDLLVK